MKKEMKKSKKSLEKEIKSVKKKTIKKKAKPKISQEKEVSSRTKSLASSAEKVKQKKSKPEKAFNTKEIKIEAEADDGKTEVEIKFTLNTTNKEKVFSEISKRTGIDIKKLDRIVEFEEDD